MLRLEIALTGEETSMYGSSSYFQIDFRLSQTSGNLTSI